jgi:hypothetical protein
MYNYRAGSPIGSAMLQFDETKYAWYRWIATNSQYFFWTLWGGGAGIFLALLASWVDAKEDTLKFYLALMTVMMAASAALVTNRTMDSIGDRRKIQRKLRIICFHIRSLRNASGGLCSKLEEIASKDGKSIKEINESMSADQAKQLSYFLDRLQFAASTPFLFDEIIEDESDYKFADIVLDHARGGRLIRPLSAIYDSGDDIMVEFVKKWTTVGMHDIWQHIGRDLESASGHFEMRAADS